MSDLVANPDLTTISLSESFVDEVANEFLTLAKLYRIRQLLADSPSSKYHFDMRGINQKRWYTDKVRQLGSLRAAAAKSRFRGVADNTLDRRSLITDLLWEDSHQEYLPGVGPWQV